MSNVMLTRIRAYLLDRARDEGITEFPHIFRVENASICSHYHVMRLSPKARNDFEKTILTEGSAYGLALKGRNGHFLIELSEMGDQHEQSARSN